MKKYLWIVLIIGCLSATACDFVPPAAATAEPAPPTAEEAAVISADNLNALSSTAVLEPIAESALCSWAVDGASFWVRALDGAYLYDAVSLDPIASHEISEYEAIYDLSPDGRTIAYSLEGLAISLFDIVDEQEILTITPNFEFSSAFFSADGSRLGVTSLEAIEVIIYNTTTGEELQRLSGFETAAPVYNAHFAADERSLIWVSRATVQPMDIASKTLMPALHHEDFVSTLRMAPDGSVIATAAAGTYEGEFTPLVTLWDPESGEAIAIVHLAEYVSALAFSPDGSLLAAGINDSITFLSVPSAEILTELDTDGISSLDFSPDGTRLLACGLDGTVTIWEAK